MKKRETETQKQRFSRGCRGYGGFSRGQQDGHNHNSLHLLSYPLVAVRSHGAIPMNMGFSTELGAEMPRKVPPKQREASELIK